MKLGLLNINNKIGGNNTIASMETLSIKSALEALGHEVVINSNDCDKLVVINGAPNFYGGARDDYIIDNYKMMAEFDGEILYFLTDLRLPFRQLYPTIQNRAWNDLTEDQVHVKNIKIISQSWNIDLVKKIHKCDYDVEYFPIDRWGIYFNDLYEKNLADEKKYDLVYCGGHRGKKRVKKIQEFYINSDLDVLLCGNLKDSHFENVGENITFKKKIKTKDLLYLNSLGKATVIIGDNNYNGNITTLRVWESLLSNMIVFVDNEFDPEHRLFDDIYYIDSHNQIQERLNQVQGRPQLIKGVGDINNPTGKDEWLEQLDKFF